MKQRYFLFLAFLISSLSWGQILLSDNFNYPNDTELINNGWAITGSPSTNRLKVGTSDGLTYTGYLTTVTPGNAVSLLSGATGDDAHRTFTSQSAGSVYASFLVNVSAATTGGDYFIHFGPDPIGTSFRGRVFVKRDASNNLSFGISNASSTALYQATFDFSLNTTYLLVLKLEIVDGSNNDVASLYVNPVISASEPTTGWLVASDAITSEISIASIGIRQGGSSSTPALRLDGLRVTNVWPFSLSDATLNVIKDDISGFALYPNPVKGGKVFINSANNYAERSVQVFDVLGKQVVNQKGTQNSVDVSHLNKGIYIMKVAEEGKVATRKLVIE